MIGDVMLSLVTALLLIFGFVLHPEHARCPRGWWLGEGVKRDGRFACYPPVVGGDDDVLTGRQTSYMPPGVLRSRIYCTGGTQPIVNSDGVSVGCQRW